MAEMTPRERVVTALNHQEPDRVPLDIGGGTSTTLIVEGYERLKAEWGISGETRIMSKAFRLARLDEAVMARLGSDTRPLTVRGPLNWTPPPAEPGFFVDVWGITWRQAFYGDGCYYWELYGNPLHDATIEDLETYPWPDPPIPAIPGAGR
jgi:uroporphyrinogen decarboxylase